MKTNAMNDDIDLYLSRRLKNWAVQQRPPGLARERLLQEAALLPPAADPGLFARFTHHHSTAVPPYRAWSGGPFTQSRVWLFHQARSLPMFT